MAFTDKIKLGRIGEHLVAVDLLKNDLIPIITGIGNIKRMPDITFEHNDELWGVEVKTSIFQEGRFKKNEKGYRATTTKSGWAFAELQRTSNKIFAFVMLESDWTPYKILYSWKRDIKSSTYRYTRPADSDIVGSRGTKPSESCPVYLKSITELFDTESRQTDPYPHTPAIPYHKTTEYNQHSLGNITLVTKHHKYNSQLTNPDVEVTLK